MKSATSFALSPQPTATCVKQWFPEDPGQAGKDQAHSYVQMLSGYRVEAIRQTGDKATRADTAAAQANIGRIGMLAAPWNAAVIDELGVVPLRRARRYRRCAVFGVQPNGQQQRAERVDAAVTTWLVDWRLSP